MPLYTQSECTDEFTGMHSSSAQCMATKDRDSPPGLLSTGTASGTAIQKPFSKGCWMERRWAGLWRQGCGGPHHSHDTVPPPGNAAVTMPQGRIRGGILPCPTVSLPGFAMGTELAQGQLEDI